MKFTTIVGVSVDHRPNTSTLPNNPTCLCLKHQDTTIPKEPFKFPINAIQAYYVKAHCAICGEYLGLPESQAPEKRPVEVDTLSRERIAILSDYEMRALIAVLMKSVDHFSRHICDDIDFESLVPVLADRQAMRRRYHEWNGDPEVWEEELAAGGTFAQCRFWTYGEMLAYFAHQLAPDIERELREAGMAE